MRLICFLTLLTGCSAQLGTVLCASDDNCAPGSYCSTAGQCATPAACAGNASADCAVTTPTGLTAVGEERQISLAWNTVGGASSYVVERAIHSGGPYSAAAASESAGLIDSGLAPATTYYYVVHAIGPGGPGADSAEASALTLPAAPMNLSATPGPGEIALRWDPVANPTGYRLYRAGSAGLFASLASVAADATTYTDQGLSSGATWTYEVVALDATGAGPASAAVTASTP